MRGGGFVGGGGGGRESQLAARRTTKQTDRRTGNKLKINLAFTYNIYILYLRDMCARRIENEIFSFYLSGGNDGERDDIGIPA